VDQKYQESRLARTGLEMRVALPAEVLFHLELFHTL